MKLLIFGGTIVNEGQKFRGSVIIEDDRIKEVFKGEDTLSQNDFDKVINATDCIVMPGVIDEHVHFREPGLTEKADIDSESKAAAFGGVTSYFDMPNTIPQTTTIENLNQKFELARQKSHINYGFFFGATNSNYSNLKDIDKHRIPGIKLFMGASTGNMLVDKYASLLHIFETASSIGLPIMVHCEDSETINANMDRMRKTYGDDPPVILHPAIRSEEACFESSALAAQLAKTFNTRLHIAHISTAREIHLLGGNITGEAVVAHLLFDTNDYTTKGALIKCNPSIKTSNDRDTLLDAVNRGIISTIATDHAPHLLSQKQGGCYKAASGMPSIQFSLVSMLELSDKGLFSIERIIECMCHAPARIFEVRDRGFLSPGMKADITIVRRQETPWIVEDEMVVSKCEWSPMSGMSFHWKVEHTICNGKHVYDKGVFNNNIHGEEIEFR